MEARKNQRLATALGEYEDDIDTTVDTTQGATRSDGEQPRAIKSAYLSRFCNPQQPMATDVIGLWLRRPRFRDPSVTLPLAGLPNAKTRLVQTTPSSHGGLAMFAIIHPW
jgi:hypothetical protein